MYWTNSDKRVLPDHRTNIMNKMNYWDIFYLYLSGHVFLAHSKMKVTGLDGFWIRLTSPKPSRVQF